MAEGIITEQVLQTTSKTELIDLAKSRDIETKSLIKEQLREEI